jgi:hypothetical protein
LGRTQTIFNTNIVPETTDFIVLGTPLKRFRHKRYEWYNICLGSYRKVKTPTLALGLDANGENREINAQTLSFNTILEWW